MLNVKLILNLTLCVCLVIPRYLYMARLPGGIDLQFGIEVSLFNLRPLKAKTLTTHMTILDLQCADDNALVTHATQWKTFKQLLT